MNDILTRVLPLYLDFFTYRAYCKVIRVPPEMMLILQERFTRRVELENDIEFDRKVHYYRISKEKFHIEYLWRELRYYEVDGISGWIYVLPNGLANGKYEIKMDIAEGNIHDSGNFALGVREGRRFKKDKPSRYKTEQFYTRGIVTGLYRSWDFVDGYGYFEIDYVDGVENGRRECDCENYLLHEDVNVRKCSDECGLYTIE